ncbi:hypothetical protein [Sphingobium yanoikuyae]|nr:hypothetical protein [Sphingobium yanoikuyae]
MDWQSVKSAICEGRRFTQTAEGCSVLSDTLMPSGGLIKVHFVAKTDHLMAHDGGAAFDELARHAVEISSMRGVRRLLSETNFNLSDDGIIWRDRFSIEEAPIAVSLIADASLRAASYMMAKGKVSGGIPLDERLRDELRRRFPNGHPNYEFAGKHRQHKFDFGMQDGSRTILVQSVNPEQSSIASAILKGLDVKAESSNVVPIFVFDRNDRWSSGSLGMLDLGGRSMEIDAALGGQLLAA